MTTIILPKLAKPMKLIRSNRCENCFWAEVEGPASKNFECHKNPPAVGFVVTNNGPVPVAAFAVVRPDQWCGGHDPKMAPAGVKRGDVTDAVVVDDPTETTGTESHG